jgi:hypothetical protein
VRRLPGAPGKLTIEWNKTVAMEANGRTITASRGEKPRHAIYACDRPLASESDGPAPRAKI